MKTFAPFLILVAIVLVMMALDGCVTRQVYDRDLAAAYRDGQKEALEYSEKIVRGNGVPMSQEEVLQQMEAYENALAQMGPQ